MSISLKSLINYQHLRSYYFAQFSLYAYDDQGIYFASNPYGLNYSLYSAVSDNTYKPSRLNNIEMTGNITDVTPVSEAGYTEDSRFYISKDGFQCNIYVDETNNEVMVSFTGTETNNSQDGLTDLNAGINQWLNNGSNILKMIDKAKEHLKTTNLINLEDIVVNFTGHSLGGGLAQMAAYDYVNDNGLNSKINMETFNSLGASYSIKKIIEEKTKSPKIRKHITTLFLII